MRCFVALVPPSTYLGELALYIEEYSKMAPDWRWVRPEGAHMTLAFLGEIGARAMGVAAEAVQAVSGRPLAPLIRFGRPQGFPARSTPRVWCLSPVSGIDAMRELWRAFNSELAARTDAAGLAPLNRDWARGRPLALHLTLARPKHRGARLPDGGNLPGILAEELECRRIVLFDSVTGTGGARYRVVSEAIVSPMI
ncbi:MAG: hypothetical protein E4H20_03255 [Spirochaetales bacterium]|nr:MAG: hypothetical protein E4H20_03255 [Spirochaetales bacterium]